MQGIPGGGEGVRGRHADVGRGHHGGAGQRNAGHIQQGRAGKAAKGERTIPGEPVDEIFEREGAGQDGAPDGGIGQQREQGGIQP